MSTLGHDQYSSSWLLILFVFSALGASSVHAEPEPMRPVTNGEKKQTTAQPSGKTGLEIPKPTVVLKPGEVPAIRFDAREHDFGRVRTDRDVVHDYWFTNTGTGPLEILRVKPSCGCTTAGAYDRIVPPGARGRIPIKLTANKLDKTFSKHVFVHTNIAGPDRAVRLVFKGEVWFPVEVSPRSAAFGRLSLHTANMPQSRTLSIINNVAAPLTPTSIRSDNPRFAAEIKTIAPGKKFELVVSLVPPLLNGNNTATITIETGLAEMPRLEIAAYGYVTAPLDVSPSALTITPGRTGPIQRRFFVRSNDGRPFEIKNLTSSSPLLSLSIKDLRRDRKSYELSVTIPPKYSPGTKGDTIRFDTSHPAARSLSIPVRARHKARG